MTFSDVDFRAYGPSVAERAGLLVDASRELWARGLTVGTFGNASLRVPGTGAVLIKGTGVCMGTMTAADAVLVSLDGEVLAGERAPSRELEWHLGIYRRRPDVDAVVHAHPPNATALAFRGCVPPLLHPEIQEALGTVGLVDYAPPGSPRLAALVTCAFRSPDVRAAVLRDHGITTVGVDLSAAVRLADRLEDAAREEVALEPQRLGRIG